MGGDLRNDQATHDSGIRNAATGTGSAGHRILNSEVPQEPNKEVRTMPDDKTDRGQRDRSRVAAEQQYEVEYFAKKHGVTTEEAAEIITRAGPSRERARRNGKRPLTERSALSRVSIDCSRLETMVAYQRQPRNLFR
jgi:hypothetical protein